MIEEGTTNLLTANQTSAETDLSGFVAFGSTTISRDTTEHWQGGASLKVVCPGTTGGEGVFVAYPATSNTAYTGSVWLKGSGTFGVELRDDTNAVYHTPKVVTLNGDWQRVVTNPLAYGSTAGNLLLIVWGTNPSGATFYADGWQLEQKPYATSWSPGSKTSVVPIMTADNAPSPYVASTSFTQYPGQYAFYAFDGNPDTVSHSDANPALPATFNIDLGANNGRVVTSYDYAPQMTYATRCPKDWLFQGSNDGINWTTLDARTNYTGWVSNISPSFFSFTNTKAYRYYRIHVTATNGDAYLTTSGITLYEGSQRNPEELTVPISAALNPTVGSIELDAYRDTSDYIDYANVFNVIAGSANRLGLEYDLNGSKLFRLAVADASGTYADFSGTDFDITVGTWHKICVTWNNGVYNVFMDGALVPGFPHTATNYPSDWSAGTLDVGCATIYGGRQINGKIKDLRLSNRVRTLAEHQAAYNSGLPLAVDDATTLLMPLDGHLKPTVRDYGLWTKNGRIILQDPQSGQGIELWDGNQQKVLIGRLDDGTVGQIIRGGKLYSSEVRTGDEDSTSYIAMVPPNGLVAYNGGKKVFETWANSNQGHLSFLEDGVHRGSIAAGGQATPTLYIRAEDDVKVLQRLYLQGSSIEVWGGNSLILHADTIDLEGGMGGSIYPYHDDSYSLGYPLQRWGVVWAHYVNTGDLCFEERECAICGQPFASGDMLILLVNQVNEGLGTMTIPIHEGCKGQGVVRTVEVPETETRYRLNKDTGTLEEYKVIKYIEESSTIMDLADGYALDDITGVFRKKAKVETIAKEGYIARITDQDIKYYEEKPDGTVGQEVALRDIMEPVEIFPEELATIEQAVVQKNITSRRPVMKQITITIGTTASTGPSVDKPTK